MGNHQLYRAFCSPSADSNLAINQGQACTCSDPADDADIPGGNAGVWSG